MCKPSDTTEIGKYIACELNARSSQGLEKISEERAKTGENRGLQGNATLRAVYANPLIYWGLEPAIKNQRVVSFRDSWRME
jgi:hypothetical protein